MYNTILPKNLNPNANTAIFLILRSDHHGDMKITNNSVFQTLLELSEPKS
jgi:hypothetical protein